MSNNDNEKFINLLDEYLDLEELEMKKAGDYLNNILDNKKYHTDSIFSVDDTITIDRYVNEYLGIIGDCSNMYHCGLKDLECSYVMGVDNEFANKNPELVKEGYLLLVIDCRGKRGTYINPVYLENILNKEEAEKELKVLSRKRDIDLKKLEEFYNQYLEQLMIVEKNKEFYSLLEKTHKVKQFNKLFKKERRNKNEKY